jgi:hypothetical protein
MEDTSSGFDNFLKVWAVLGPLLAAAASALWSRYTRIKDRDFELKQELDREKRQLILKDQEQSEAQRKEKYNEVKAVLADFMASSHEYVRKQSEYLSNPTAELHQAASTANDKFIFSGQVVTLLGNDVLANSVIQLWNATLTMPKSYNVKVDADYEEKLRVYKEMRAIFNEQARTFLLKLETKDKNS